MPLPESPIRLLGKDNCYSQQVYYNPATRDYFAKKLCLDHGWFQQLVPYMLDKLKEHLEASGLSPSFDPENPEKVAQALAQLNFNPPQSNGESKPKRKSARS